MVCGQMKGTVCANNWHIAQLTVPYLGMIQVTEITRFVVSVQSQGRSKVLNQAKNSRNTAKKCSSRHNYSD